MPFDYADNTLLRVWYDGWLVVVGFGVSMLLTVLVAAQIRRTRPRRTSTVGLALQTAMVLAVLLAVPLTLVRLVISEENAGFNDTTVGYLSLAGVLSAVVLGGGYLLQQSGQLRLPALRRRGAAVTAGGGAVEAPSTPPDGVTVAPAPGQATGTLAGEPTLAQEEQEEAGRTVTGGAAPTGVAPAAWVLFRSGPRAGQSIPLRAGETSLGRGTDNDVVLDDPAVSRRHAQITFQDGRYLLQDAGSSSGTLVEGTTVSRQELMSGTTIQLGETELVFMQTEATGVGGATATGGPRPQGPAETMVMEPAATIMAYLAVRAGPQKGKMFQLKAQDTTLGRDTTNDIVLEDASVSRHHAQLKYQDDGFIVLDVGSRGGTKVNDDVLSGRPLKPGGMLVVAQTEMTLVTVEAREAAAPAASAGETIVAQPQSVGGGVLIVQRGPDSGKSFPLAAGDNLLGRDPESAILLSDPAISRRHTLVRQEEDTVMVFDLGSRTGTRVDGELISGHRLASGDTITLGRSELVLMQVEPQGGA